MPLGSGLLPLVCPCDMVLSVSPSCAVFIFGCSPMSSHTHTLIIIVVIII